MISAPWTYARAPEQPPERIWLSSASFGYKTSPSPAIIYNQANKADGDIEYARVPASPQPDAAQSEVETCAWVVDDATDGEIWESDCDNAFVFEDGGPKDNSMKFCCYCGKSLVELRIVRDEEAR